MSVPALSSPERTCPAPTVSTAAEESVPRNSTNGKNVPM